MEEKIKFLTPVKAIRAKCLDCCCGQQSEVRLCPSEKCPLWPYRMGHRPKREEIFTEDIQISKSLDSSVFFNKDEVLDDAKA